MQFMGGIIHFLAGTYPNNENNPPRRTNSLPVTMAMLSKLTQMGRLNSLSVHATLILLLITIRRRHRCLDHGMP